MTEPTSERDLRVSDDERSHIVDILQKATGRGMIDVDEFSDRTDRAMRARTRGELNAVVIDLPGLVNAAAPAGTQAATISGSMTAIQRNGTWTVPAVLNVRNSMSPTKLDFRDAKIDHAQVEIRLDVTMGAVKIWLPKDATVNTEGLDVTMGSVKGSGITSAEQPGNPHFVITGRIGMGSLKMYRAGAGWSWRF
jgi:hypothetical protein